VKIVAAFASGKSCVMSAFAIGAFSLLAGIATAQQVSAVNRGVVELETSGSAGISVRIAEDLAKLVDDGATRRVVPVVGKAALQNLIDLKYLRGVDMAIVPIDVLDYAVERRIAAGMDLTPSYITRLYNEEFHLLARPEIKSIADLANREVNVDIQGSSTAITANRLFGFLDLSVKTNNDSQEVALQKLRSGAISALAFVAGKPAPLFLSVGSNEGLHFIPVPINRSTSNAYVPSRLASTDYPSLISQERPVDTIAVGNVLAVAELRQAPERFRNVGNFVEAFFTGFQSLLRPGHHPKWQEVSLSAELPGWRRHATADQWLQRNVQLVQSLKPDELRAMFSRFVDQRRQSTGQVTMTPEQKNELFEQFRSWQAGQAR